MTKEKKSFFRYCIRCGKPFHPTGWKCKVCKDCKKPTGFSSHRFNIKVTCPYHQYGKCTHKGSEKRCRYLKDWENCLIYLNSIIGK